MSDSREVSQLRRGIGIGLAALLAVAAAAARADCANDCSSSYEAAMTACRQANPDPSQLDQLQSCMDEAQASYGACVEHCENAPH